MITRGAQVTGVAVCSLCLTWISVSLRFYVRIFLLKSVGREDWLTVATMIPFTILCALLLRCVHYGLGAHMDAIPPAGLETAAKYIFVCELLYVVTTAVTKLSIGVYFLRLSNRVSQARIIYVTLFIVMLVSTMYFFFLLFQCSPIGFLWTQYRSGHGTCLGKTKISNITYAHAAMSAATDWVFGILPVSFVWRMQMNKRTKLSVILILSLGFFASTATIVRIFYIRQLTKTNDYSWYGINLVKWSMVEPAIAITAAAIATLRPLFKGFFLFRRRRAEMYVMDEGASNDGRQKLNPREQGYVEKINEDFAVALGLSLGVTTSITASGGKSWEMRKSRQHVKDDEARILHASSSQNHPPGTLDWSRGIKATTIVSIVE